MRFILQLVSKLVFFALKDYNVALFTEEETQQTRFVITFMQQEQMKLTYYKNLLYTIKLFFTFQILLTQQF